MKTRKFIAVFLTFVLLFNFVPPPRQAEAFISDPTDLGYLSAGAPVDVDGAERSFHGYWHITVNDANGSEIGSAKDMAIAHDFRPGTGKTGAIYNYVADSVIDDWIDLLKGNQGYVDDLKDSEIRTLSANGKSSDRIHIRELAELCGAWVKDYDANAKEVTIYTTPLPSARISYDGSTKEGDTETFRLHGNGYAAGDKGLSKWIFKIDGATIDRGYDTNRLSESVTNTFNSSGTYTATLEVWDNVGRSSSDSITVTVGSGSEPPPEEPPEPTSGPVASFDMPFSTTVGESVDIENNSRASDGHTIEDTKWDITPGNYTGNLASNGGTISFGETGTYDVELTVEDDQGKTDSVEQSIIVEEQPPPPPPPNEEPTAEFDMPGHCKQGDTVEVTNLSNDDGEIVDVDWDISPGSGYTENLDDSGGTITFSEEGDYTVELTVEDDDGATDTDVDSIEVENKPPKAEINIPDEITQGEDVTIECTSYDPDGEIVSRSWSVTPQDSVEGTIEGQESTVYFDQDTNYTLELTVEDDFGKTDTETVDISVKPAIPEAYYDWSGSPKVNRKVVFDASGSHSSDRYPIIWDQTQWEFVTPDGVSQDTVKVASTGDLSRREVLFKEPGDYKVRLAVKNTAGHTSEWYEKTISIQPDKPPVVDFQVSSAFLRNPDNNNKAAIELADNSYSPDGDIISKRVWTYRYDSDNDGSFSDETWHTLSDGNNPNPTLHTKDVGRYQFELYAEESFGQETLSQFITEEDKLSGDTSSKPLDRKTAEVINRQPVVNFDSITKKKVDIVFSVGEAEDYKLDDLKGKITRNVESKLGNANISYGTIESITASNFSSNDADAGLIFNSWERYGYNKDSWRYDSYNNTIERKDNSYWAGFYDPNFDSNNYTIEVEGTGGSDTDDIGVTFAMKNGEFYAYNLDGYGNGPYPTMATKNHNHGTGVYKGEFGSDYVDLTEAVEKGSGSWDANNYSKIKIEVKGTRAKIYVDGNLEHVLYDFGGFGGSFGLYTNSTPDGRFKNLKVTSKQVKTLDEILKEPSWRNDAQHFIVNISDKELPGLNDPEKAPVIYSRLLNDEIHYCMMGTNTNKNQTQEVININGDRGKFVYNSNMEPALENIADYIINEVNEEQGKKTQYVLLDEEIEYKTFYRDKENDPEIERRWKYSHDPYYFDNNLGEASYDEQFIGAPVKKFSKTGKFETVFQAKDNPKNDSRFADYRQWSYMPKDKLNIYVHRKPIALFTSVLSDNGTNYNINLTSKSYDPDHQTEADKGIVASEWKWKKQGSTHWNSGKPSTLNAGDIYLVYHRVKDKEGVWSSPNTRVVSTTGANLSPVASFYVTPKPLPLGKTLDYEDLSYDPDGDDLVKYRWRSKKEGGSWTNHGASKPMSFGSTGTYTIELKVRDEHGAWSEPVYQTVEVIPGNTKPVAQFNVTPSPAPIDVPVEYEENSYDPDGDPIVARQWQYHKVGESWKSGHPTDFSSLGTGDYQVRLRVKDDPALTQMDALWSSWYTVDLKVIPGNQKPVAQFSVSPNPAIADQPVTYDDNSYDPEGAGITERVWRVEKPDGTILGEYRNSIPPKVFSNTGWGDMGAGDYRIGLKVKDKSPNGISPPLWSDWTWCNLKVIIPLEGSGEITPDPAPSGYNVDITVDTEGYADEVTVKFPGDSYFSGDEVTLTPQDPVSDKFNTFKGNYKTDLETPNGTYNVTATIKRTNTAPETITIPLSLAIQGDIYDQVKVRKKDTR